MKNKNNASKTSAVLFYVASALFYVTAIFSILNDTGSGVMYLGPGSCFLCLGSVQAAKLKKEKENKYDGTGSDSQ